MVKIKKLAIRSCITTITKSNEVALSPSTCVLRKKKKTLNIRTLKSKVVWLGLRDAIEYYNNILNNFSCLIFNSITFT